MSKWIMIAILTAMLPLARYIGHNKDADCVNQFCGDFVFYGLLICIVLVAIFAPSYFEMMQ